MSESKGCWVLTSEYNDYDQHGAYFEAVFSGKPTVEYLAEYFGHTKGSVSGNVMDTINFLTHLVGGGGRRKYEDRWFLLEYREFYK